MNCEECQRYHRETYGKNMDDDYCEGCDQSILEEIDEW